MKLNAKHFSMSKDELEWLKDEFKLPYENIYSIAAPVNGMIYKYILEMQDGQFAIFQYDVISGTHFPIGHTSNFTFATSFYKEELPKLHYYMQDLKKFSQQGWEPDNDTDYQWCPEESEGWSQKDYFVPKQIKQIELKLK